MLIQVKESMTARTNDMLFSSPLVGVRGSNLPTSADVHLYADPDTYETITPILYADCEGLEGGSKLPSGAVESLVSPGCNASSDFATSRKRRLEWARRPDTRKREYVVTQLYPRILYTFSDVVVFVLQNPK